MRNAYKQFMTDNTPGGSHKATSYEGRKIQLPAKYRPAEDFLSRHRRQAMTV